MEKTLTDEMRLNQLINYYKEKGLLIVGLNDSQGVNTTSTFFRKGLLEYLAFALTSEELTPEVINAFSLLINKTEHIDYILKHNLSLEEIKLSQVSSVVSALEKVMRDVRLPRAIGKVGNLYRLIYQPVPGDENLRITTSLKNANEPVLIYSSGVNDLMREVGANPFGIKADYNDRDKRPNFYYTLKKANNPQTLSKVINGIDRNFDNILSINDSTDVYTLGAYIPKSLQIEEMNVFRDLIIAYNDALKTLCRQYGITFIDTEEVGRKYNSSERNFHVSTKGHSALASYILGYIYYNKITMQRRANYHSNNAFKTTDEGSQGVINSIQLDYERSCDKIAQLSGYAKTREIEIADEHRRETEVFQKVLKKTRK